MAGEKSRGLFLQHLDQHPKGKEKRKATIKQFQRRWNRPLPSYISPFLICNEYRPEKGEKGGNHVGEEIGARGLTFYYFFMLGTAATSRKRKGQKYGQIGEKGREKEAIWTTPTPTLTLFLFGPSVARKGKKVRQNV